MINIYYHVAIDVIFPSAYTFLGWGLWIPYYRKTE